MISNQINQGLKAVDACLRSVISTDVQLLNEASHHIIESGGKRLRPRLALLSYLAAGGENVEQVAPLAAAVELVHTATLVHDDINDHSLTRRGKVTVHARWGRTFALLTGDYLFTKVYEMMAPYGAAYNVIMAEACVRLVEGETLQAQAAKAGELDRESYKTIIARKTASLFEASARMGAMLGGGDEKIVTALGHYAHYLGLAFQIVDDILDIVGDPQKMGKPAGADVSQGRGVLMIKNGQSTHTPIAVLAPEPEADPMQKLMRRLRESGAIEAARLQALEMSGRARQALALLPPSPARQEMEWLIDSVIDREQ